MAQKFVVDTRINREGQEEYLSTRTYVGMAHIAGTRTLPAARPGR
jgi:hypothetical protein